jgi:hypothetical protein
MMTALAFGMMAAVLALAAWVVTGSGQSVLLALLLLALGVGSVNTLIEAVVFGVVPLGDVPSILLRQVLVAASLSLAALAITGKWREGDHKPAVALTLTPMRLAAASIGYLVLYLTAGMLVFPFVKDFYATRALPPLAMLVLLQLARGLLYVLYVWPWLRLAPRRAGIVLGLIYAVLGGVAPLLADNNPYLPRAVRIPHLVEVGVSNFLFGMVVGWLAGMPVKQRRHSRGGSFAHVDGRQ